MLKQCASPDCQAITSGLALADVDFCEACTEQRSWSAHDLPIPAMVDATIKRCGSCRYWDGAHVAKPNDYEQCGQPMGERRALVFIGGACDDQASLYTAAGFGCQGWRALERP